MILLFLVILNKNCIYQENYIFNTPYAKLDFAHALIKNMPYIKLTCRVKKLDLVTRSNKKTCPTLSFSHVMSKNSVRYTSEKVILSSCGPFTLA